MIKYWDDLDDDLLLEFDAEGAPKNEEEEEDFSMGDEGEETPEGETPAEPAADEAEEEDFSMGDEGEEEAEPAEANEPPADEAGEEEFSMDDEGGDEGDNPPPPAEEGDEGGEENYEIPDEDEGGDDQPQGDQEAPPADDGEEEFSMDGDGGDEGGEDQSAQDQGDDQQTDDSSSTDDTTSKLKELEAVIFDELSDEEKAMKTTELKALYISVYNKCGSISELLTAVKKDEETIQIIEYISNTLLDLKEYVNDYINKVFDSKSYIENLSQLQKYIMIFNAINKVFEQIKAEKEE